MVAFLSGMPDAGSIGGRVRSIGLVPTVPKLDDS